MHLYRVGEDEVTQAILDRLLREAGGVDSIEVTKLPARGGKVLGDLNKYNKLAETDPVILLTDLDNCDCPKDILGRIDKKHENFLCRIAVTEAESWLMADREGFASYIGISVDQMPVSKKLRPYRNGNDMELEIHYKPSLFMMRELARISSKPNIVQGLTPLDNVSKGPLYNSTLLPFIENEWDIQNAMTNSYSLTRTVNRIAALLASKR